MEGIGNNLRKQLLSIFDIDKMKLMTKKHYWKTYHLTRQEFIRSLNKELQDIEDKKERSKNTAMQLCSGMLKIINN
jgi:hypothetical protein